MVGNVSVVADERSKLELPVGVGIGGRGDLPYLYLPAEAYGEVAAGWRESECGGRRSEREMVYGYATRDVG